MSEEQVTSDSRYRVAFDLMSKIVSRENKIEQPDARTYYLKLYHQCLRATFVRDSLKDILNEEA